VDTSSENTCMYKSCLKVSWKKLAMGLKNTNR
jgi:hypothetical protein